MSELHAFTVVKYHSKQAVPAIGTTGLYVPVNLSPVGPANTTIKRGQNVPRNG
jgi:hypothetical protein